MEKIKQETKKRMDCLASMKRAECMMINAEASVHKDEDDFRDYEDGLLKFLSDPEDSKLFGSIHEMEKEDENKQEYYYALEKQSQDPLSWTEFLSHFSEIKKALRLQALGTLFLSILGVIFLGYSYLIGYTAQQISTLFALVFAFPFLH